MKFSKPHFARGADFRFVLFLETEVGKAQITEPQLTVWGTCSPVDHILSPGPNAGVGL